MVVISLFVTVTVQEAEMYVPSAEVAVIFAVPAFTALTSAVRFPDEETVATDVSEEAQDTFFVVAPVGVTVAVKVFVSPTVREAALSLNATPVTAVTEEAEPEDFAVAVPKELLPE